VVYAPTSVSTSDAELLTLAPPPPPWCAWLVLEPAVELLVPALLELDEDWAAGDEEAVDEEAPAADVLLWVLCTGSETTGPGEGEVAPTNMLHLPRKKRRRRLSAYRDFLFRPPRRIFAIIRLAGGLVVRSARFPVIGE